MTDTQWPRYEVFKQDNPKKPHEAVGSVHAPDDELALQNARDVFVRRPSAVSLWVVKADNIFTMTREELAARPDFWLKVSKADGTPTTFHIFTKTSQRRSMTYVQHVGQVEATSAQAALRHAIQSGQFDNHAVWVWWVVQENQIIHSGEEDIESLFAPAVDKTYRQQTHYGFVSPRRQKREHLRNESE